MPNKDCLHLMTQKQLMQTRLRQIQLEQIGTLTKDRAKKLNAEEDALVCLISEGGSLEGQHLKDLKQAIKTNVSPAELDNKSDIQGEDQLMKTVKEATTEELVEEIENREGVSVTKAGPEEKAKAAVDGPAILIEVID